MVLFDWKKIYSASKGDSFEIIRIFDMLTYNRIPVNWRDPLNRYQKYNFIGESFIVRPKALLEQEVGASNKEIAVYIALASLRNLGEYLTQKTTTLELIKIPIRQELFINNKLLLIQDDIVHFLLEE